MIENSELLSKLQQLLTHKKSKAYYASKLNITELEVEDLLKELRKEEIIENKWIEESTKKVNNDKGTLESSIELDFEPKSDEDLYKLHKINKELYKISSYWSKLKSNGKFTSSVFATLKKPQDYTPEDFAKFLSNWQPIKSAYSWSLMPDLKLEDVDIELNIADFHLGKKTFQGDTLESKTFDYYKAINDLVSKVRSSYNIKKIVFPIGNDMFHSDNYQNSTTNLTPQDVNSWYNEEYEKGFELLANSISFLSTQAKEVEVILVQGNHDRTKGFFVAHALEVFFQKEKNIKFQRHHSVTKHTIVGNTFIGYHHGNSSKLEDLPLLFATGEQSKDFGNSKYREVHTGDKHFYLAKEVKGVRIQQVPSLSGTDRWHQDNGYINQIRAAIAFVYHPEKGKIAEFEHRI